MFTHVFCFHLIAGVSHYIFDNATHSRAIHCIGTGFLSYRLLEILERNSNRKIVELHKKCVVVSGSCIY